MRGALKCLVTLVSLVEEFSRFQFESELFGRPFLRFRAVSEITCGFALSSIICFIALLFPLKLRFENFLLSETT